MVRSCRIVNLVLTYWGQVWKKKTERLPGVLTKITNVMRRHPILVFHNSDLALCTASPKQNFVFIL